MTQTRLIACLVTVTLAVLPLPASSWNIPAHMLAAAIGYQVLQQESPQSIEKIKAVLDKHPWYANQWQARLQEVPAADRDIVLFMQAPGGPMMLASGISTPSVSLERQEKN